MISVITTTYNCAEYVGQAIQSILNQTYRDFELLIIDDGSTDTTSNILNNFSDPRISFLKTNHLGRSKALNYALQNITNNFIAILDADDFANPERLEKQYNFLCNNSNIDIVGSWANLVSNSNEIIGKLRKPLNNERIRSNMLSMNGISFGTILFRYDQINYKLFNENLTNSEDLDWLYHNSFSCKFYNIPEFLMNLRQREMSLSRSKELNYKSLKISLLSFISGELSNYNNRRSKALLIRDEGLCEYYYGSIGRSIILFYKSFLVHPLSIINLRYIFSSLLIFLLGKSYRSNKYFILFANFFRYLIIKSSMSKDKYQ